MVCLIGQGVGASCARLISIMMICLLWGVSALSALMVIILHQAQEVKFLAWKRNLVLRVISNKITLNVILGQDKEMRRSIGRCLKSVIQIMTIL